MFYHNARCIRLGFGIVSRMAGWGALLGAIFGGASGFVLGLEDPSLALIFGIFGALAGGASGLMLGLGIGSTLVLFSINGMPTDINGYVRIARAISVYWIILGAIAIGLFLRIRPEDVLVYVAGIAIPALIALGAAR